MGQRPAPGLLMAHRHLRQARASSSTFYEALPAAACSRLAWTPLRLALPWNGPCRLSPTAGPLPLRRLPTLLPHACAPPPCCAPQTLAKLHHRNIVQFYGACLEIGSMFFATELMKVGFGVVGEGVGKEQG